MKTNLPPQQPWMTARDYDLYCEMCLLAELSWQAMIAKDRERWLVLSRIERRLA